MKKIIFFILAAITMSACSYDIPPFRHVLFIDFEDIRSYGVEVTNGDMPQGAVTLGPYVESVFFGRAKKRMGKAIESDAFPNNAVFKTKTIYIGSQDSDLKSLNKSIAEEIKAIGGDGIANLTVKQLYNNELSRLYKMSLPLYHIEGIIYKNK